MTKEQKLKWMDKTSKAINSSLDKMMQVIGMGLDMKCAGYLDGEHKDVYVRYISRQISEKLDVISSMMQGLFRMSYNLKPIADVICAYEDMRHDAWGWPSENYIAGTTSPTCSGMEKFYYGMIRSSDYFKNTIKLLITDNTTEIEEDDENEPELCDECAKKETEK